MKGSARTAGMTLIEVLCALVLLSALAASSLPLLIQANRVARAPGPAFDLVELSRLADLLRSDPKAFGFEATPEQASLAWPDHPGRSAVAMRTVMVGDPPTHLWRIFECEGVSVSQWAEWNR